jgi:hypothetical protein
MPTFRAQLLYSTHAGRTAEIDRPKFSFGRAAENALVIEMPQASRVHGHIVYDDEKWYLVNKSPNGTTVNGRKVTTKAHILKHGDVIGVGKTAMFAAMLEDAPAAAAPPTQKEADNAIRQQLTPEEVAARKRLRLWLGIGVYLLVVLAVMVVVSQALKKGDNQGPAAATQLSRQQIKAEITKPLDRPTYQRDANEWLGRARSLYNRRHASPRNLYDAYVAYKEALAYSGKPVFEDGLVYREFKTCETDLAKRVADTYTEAYAMLRNREYEAAEREFRRLVQEIGAHQLNGPRKFWGRSGWSVFDLNSW